jgi:pimeloyl-ACP methyl ester carboxylesterase
MLGFLLLPIAPFLIAAVVLTLGLWAWRARVRRAGSMRIVLQTLGMFTVALAMLLLLGATITVYEQAKTRRAYPAPGKMVDFRGTSLHVWCEGPASAPTVLLIGGGHSQALWMRPMLVGLSDRWRACAVDRAGLGWSGGGRVPVTLDDEIDQMHGALAAAGEHFAVAAIGHSGGGEFAMNYAGAYPDEVKALVLLDPSSPAYSLVDWRGSGLKVRLDDCRLVFSTMFGLAYIDALNPLHQPDMAWLHDVFGKYWQAGVTWEARPASIIEGISAHKPPGSEPFSIVRTPGALDAQSILLITQVPDPPRPWPGLSKREAKNFVNLLNYARIEPLYLSPHHSQLVYAPPNSTHYFLYTQAAFTLEHVTQFLQREVPPPAQK